MKAAICFGLITISGLLSAREWSWYTTINGNRHCFVITDEMVAATPRWKNESPTPPLAPRDAIKLARAELGLIVTNANEWEFNGLSLHQLKSEQWYYTIDFRFLPVAQEIDLGDFSFWPVIEQPNPPVLVRRGRPLLLKIPVLLNGVPVHPVSEQRELR